nr:hypothetical protein DSAG12_01881 [Candidatus Prometheoarchaeum syntrophicum]
MIFGLSPGFFLHYAISNKKFRFILIPYYFALGIFYISLITLLLEIFHINSLLLQTILIIIIDFFLIWIILINKKKGHTTQKIQDSEENSNRKYIHFKNYSFESNSFLSICLSIIIILISLILFISNLKYPQYDTWVYYYRCMDVLNYDFSLFAHFGTYIDDIVNSNLIIYVWNFIFLISPQNFYFHNFILTITFPIIQIAIFLILIYTICVKILKVNPIYTFGIYLAGYYLNTWLSFTLPSSLSLIFVLLVLIEFYSSSKITYSNMGRFFVLAIFLFHRTTFLLIFLLIILYDMKEFFSIFKKGIFNFPDLFRRKFNVSINKKTFVIIFYSLLFCIFLASSLIFHDFIGNLLIFIFDRLAGLFPETKVFYRYFIPSIDLWFSQLSGPLIFIFGITYPYRKNKKRTNLSVNTNILGITYIFTLLLLAICLLLPYWSLISFFPYIFYRYFIFLDVSLIIIAPVSMKYWIPKISSFLKKKIFKNKKQTTILKYIKGAILLQIILYSFVHISSNYSFFFFNAYVKDEHIESYIWMKENTGHDDLILILPHPISNSLNAFSQSILYDRYVVGFNESKYLFNTLLNRYYYLDNYLNDLIDYLNYSRKVLRQNGRVLSEKIYTTEKSVKYLVIESVFNEDLYELIKDSPSFIEIYHEYVQDYYVSNIKTINPLNYSLSIFEIQY